MSVSSADLKTVALVAAGVILAGLIMHHMRDSSELIASAHGGFDS